MTAMMKLSNMFYRPFALEYLPKFLEACNGQVTTIDDKDVSMYNNDRIRRTNRGFKKLGQRCAESKINTSPAEFEGKFLSVALKVF